MNDTPTTRRNSRRRTCSATRTVFAGGISALLMLAAGLAARADDGVPDVVFEPTPQRSVEAMLRVARVGPHDMVYDLGSGDGRIVVTAARLHGARGMGVDIAQERVDEGRERARRRGVQDQVEFVRVDLFEVDVEQASVVTLYLLPSLNLRLRPRLLEQLQPGARVVSYRYDMGDWEPDLVANAGAKNIYLWIIPAAVDGRWEVRGPDGEHDTLDLRQRHQLVSGTILSSGGRETILAGRLDGRRIRLETKGRVLEGRVEDGVLTLLDPTGQPLARGTRVGPPVITP